MRNLIFLIAIIAINLQIFAQDKESYPHKFNYTFNGVAYNNQILSQPLLKQKEFLLSTQWGGNLRMLDALKMGYNHGSVPYKPWDNVLDTNTTGKTFNYLWCHWTYESCIGFRFNPTLLIPDNYDGSLITRNGDTTNPIWGFRYR